MSIVKDFYLIQNLILSHDALTVDLTVDWKFTNLRPFLIKAPVDLFCWLFPTNKDAPFERLGRFRFGHV